MSRPTVCDPLKPGKRAITLTPEKTETGRGSVHRNV
jgi:hypothetical protein